MSGRLGEKLLHESITIVDDGRVRLTPSGTRSTSRA